MADNENDIHARMEAMRQDHIRMGVIPADEPEGDAHETTLPLTRKGSKQSVAEEVSAEKTAKAKKPTK